MFPPERCNVCLTGTARLSRSQAGHRLPTWLERLSIGVDGIDYHLISVHRRMHVRCASLLVSFQHGTCGTAQCLTTRALSLQRRNRCDPKGAPVPTTTSVTSQVTGSPKATLFRPAFQEKPRTKCRAGPVAWNLEMGAMRSSVCPPRVEITSQTQLPPEYKKWRYKSQSAACLSLTIGTPAVNRGVQPVSG